MRKVEYSSIGEKDASESPNMGKTTITLTWFWPIFRCRISGVRCERLIGHPIYAFVEKQTEIKQRMCGILEDRRKAEGKNRRKNGKKSEGELGK
jgi:hypothetical protein